jgi:hypothetical protein
MTAGTWSLAAVALALSGTGLLAQRGQPPARAQEQAEPQGMPFDHVHAAWTRILERHVEGDRFDYEALSLERGPLDEYLLSLRGVQAADYAEWTRQQRQAFWINAYNAFTVQLVLSRYPIRSIQLIATPAETPWSREFVPLGHLIGGAEASKISLDTIEHGILGPQFEDARSHVALHRAAESSPPTGRAAFQAEGLDRQLDAHVRAWLADRRYNRFDPDEGTAQVSELLDWYEGDFVREAGSLRAWLARYVPDDLASWLEEEEEPIGIELLPWSWELDDVEREKR